jgi:predicted kinase
MTIALLGMGIPGSGKSSFFKPLAAELGFLYVSRDDVRARLLGDADDRSQQETVADAADAMAFEALRAGTGVIYDGTFAEPKKRRMLVRALLDAGADRVLGVLINTPLPIALSRNAERERQVPESVIREMHESFERQPPALGESFFKVYAEKDTEHVREWVLKELED